MTQSLITAAHESGVDFYYALSPGLDITYSNSKEVSLSVLAIRIRPLVLV
jgi:hypothetical protein